MDLTECKIEVKIFKYQNFRVERLTIWLLLVYIKGSAVKIISISKVSYFMIKCRCTKDSCRISQ